MPKKHRKSFIHTKPVNTPHHSIGSSGANQNAPQTGQFTNVGSSRGLEPSDSSVNDLIGHLRRTQVSNDSSPSAFSHSFASQRSIPPALRNILELPEPPAPRPRRQTPIGARPRRFAPGPPPPESWLTGATRDSQATGESLEPALERKIIYCLDRLPGAIFPQPNSLLHAVLKSIAQKWDWHTEYDGLFMSQIPAHLKTLVLSYIAFYGGTETRRNRINGLKPLYPTKEEYATLYETDPSGEAIHSIDADSMTTRLDLGNAIGYRMTFRQLAKELQLANTPSISSEQAAQDSVPESWDQTEDEVEESSIPGQIGHTLRFKNLKYLSFAHPYHPTADWSSLVKLLSHLPTITHLSLAHWPRPGRKPQVAHKLAGDEDLQEQPGHEVRPGSRSPVWAEASATLRHLSKNTYCLKWLDLEGCSSWLVALTWRGFDPDGVPYPAGTNGPDWTGSWRNVDFLNLAPGWVVQSIPGASDSGQSSDELESFETGDDGDKAKRQRAREFSRFQVDVLVAEEMRALINKRRTNAKGKWLAAKTGREELQELKLQLKRLNS
ncbi:hypothetical protein N7478_010343 [Penicillium angulare]|uniref:uncharacterized protein n=1 Tax=Penicillium angulare TaxID=116970 RepID=UPI002540FD4F|nr:uncharacterized protein N7478_010343 [Penicillium angulare]KAJ5267535.1 hypothetical protein N7478_010343 [Penicillium angulare]